MSNITKIAGWNLLGASLLLSWFLLPGHGLWARWDVQIFYGLNGLLAGSSLVSLLCHPFYTLFLCIGMGGLLLWLGRGAPQARWRAIMLWLAVCLLLVLGAGWLLPIQRASPILALPGALGLERLAAYGLPDSFPAVPALVGVTFAAVMGRFAPRPLAWGAALMVPLFCLPGLACGVHWLSDMLAGSLALACLLLPWLLLTPLASSVVKGVDGG